MNEPRYEYDNLKVDQPMVDDGWYLVKDGLTYRVDVPMNKMRFTKSVNILTGEVHYPSNADRIRAMTDEELAVWMSARDVDLDPKCPPSGPLCVDYNDCASCWLDWLKQEVTDE